MALQVWLPLDGSMENLGLDDINVVNQSISGFSAGKIGQAFNTLNSYYYFDVQTLVNATVFSCAFWFKQNDSSSLTTNWRRIVSFWTKADGTTTSGMFRFESSYALAGYAISTHSNSAYQICPSGVGNRSLVAASGEWHHIAVTVDGTTIAYYVDGKLHHKGAQTDGYLTGRVAICETGNQSDGWLNDLRIYDHALSVKEVKELSKALIAHYPLNDKIGLPNLMLDSLPKNTTNWALTPSSGDKSWEFIEKDGCKCFHITGELSKTKAIIPTFSTTNAKNYIPEPGEIVTMSCDVLFENVVLGPTNAYVQLYGSGATVDGVWRGNVVISDSGHSKAFHGWYNLDPDKLNGVGWTHVYITYQYLNYEYPFVAPSFYARDFSGDVYAKCFKFEKGSVATPWVPNEADSEYSELGLDEDTIYDCSGYCRNGDSDTVDIDSDTPRYQIATNFVSKSFIHATPNLGDLSQVSISFWVKQSSGSGYYSTVISNSTTLGTSGLWLAVNTESVGLWYYSSAYCKSTKGKLPTGEWYHATFVFDNGIATWYQDGEFAGTSNVSAKRTSIPINDLYIGDSYTGSSWITTFIGSLSDVRIYATALSPEDIKELYETSASVDQNGNTWAYELVEE